MGKNPFYTKLQVDNETFLAPYGTASAAALSPVEVNEAFLDKWEGEMTGEEREGLPSKLFSECFNEEEGEAFFTACIADINMSFYDHTGGLTSCLKDFMEKFLTDREDGKKADRAKENCAKSAHRVSVLWENTGIMDKLSLLLMGDEMSVYECEDYYLIHFHAFECVKKVIILKDLLSSYIYMKRTSSLLKEELEMAVRNIFALLQLNKGRVFLHSSSILYKDKVWCFSAKAGTGKSTHTSMWIQEGAAAVNGDLNLLGLEDGKAVVYGTPWCGTSGLYSEKDFELGGIVLLNRGKENLVLKVEKHRSISLLARTVSPMWTETLLKKNARIVESIAAVTNIAGLECRPDKEAYLTMKAYIDNL